MKLRLGTRTSLLAMAQSHEIARALQLAHPDLEIEFVGITTSGDRDTSKPLWQMDVVGIFTREIDEKLLAGEIDFAVHSLKDLGTQRPAGLVTAAIPPRAPPYDVVLFRADIMDVLRTGRAINIGTSAPRRNQLVPEFLVRALPRLSDKPIQINIQTLRGNVDTRVGRLHETGDRALDGVVLAFAGLKRLYADAAGQKILQEKLNGVKWLVLPLTVCPGAPGQGALALEARADDTQTQQILHILNHAPTAARIADEMDVLRAHGGGCHQKFGVVSLQLPNMAAPITLVRGHDESGKPVDETRTSAPDFSGKKIWSGKAWTRKIFDMQRIKPARNDFPAVFAANSRAVPTDVSRNARLWTSGTPSWFHLADQGLWVEGCADGFGFDFIREFLAEPVLQLPPLSEWGVYTHVDAAADWQNMHIEPTYKLVPNPPPACIAELERAEVVIWASGSQFDALHPYARADAQHVAGPGKTAEHLLSQGIKNLVVMPLFD